MPHNYFRFKQFSIYQDKCAMKVGTDGVVLGAWVDVSKNDKILDVGTGTGLIALMLAQKSSTRIIALEIDEGAAGQARENFERSDWSERIDLESISFQEYAKHCSEKFNHIVSNPPFFKNSLGSGSHSRTIARHATRLSLEDLMVNSSALLESGGKLSIIFPALDFETNLKTARESGFGLKRYTHVTPHPNKKPNRLLAEFVIGFQGKAKHNMLMLYTDTQQTRSPEYAFLAREYYLDK